MYIQMYMYKLYKDTALAGHVLLVMVSFMYMDIVHVYNVSKYMYMLSFSALVERYYIVTGAGQERRS